MLLLHVGADLQAADKKQYDWQTFKKIAPQVYSFLQGIKIYVGVSPGVKWVNDQENPLWREDVLICDAHHSGKALRQRDPQHFKKWLIPVCVNHQLTLVILHLQEEIMVVYCKKSGT